MRKYEIGEGDLKRVHWPDEYLVPFHNDCQATWQLWQYGLLSFQGGDIKLEIFLPKNQHTQRKLLNFFCRHCFYEVKYLCFLFNLQIMMSCTTTFSGY